MNFKFNKKLREVATEICKSIVPRKFSSMPVLTNVLFEANESLGEVAVIGSDGNVFVRYCVEAEVGESGKILFPANMLLNFFGKVPVSDIEFNAQDNESITISIHNAEYQIFNRDHSHFPNFDALTGAPFVPLLNFKAEALADQLCHAASTDPMRPQLCGINLQIGENLKGLATNGIMISMLEMEITQSDFAVNPVDITCPPLFLKAISNLPKGEETTGTLHVLGNKIEYRCGNLQVTCNLFEGEYPRKTLSKLPESSDKLLTSDVRLLIKAIETAEVMDKATGRIVLKLDETECSVSASSLDEGRSHIELDPAFHFYEGKNIELAARGKFLKTALRRVNTDFAKVYVSNSKRHNPIMITNHYTDDQEPGVITVRHYVMPMRIS